MRLNSKGTAQVSRVTPRGLSWAQTTILSPPVSCWVSRGSRKRGNLLIAGLAGLVAGAMSMAAVSMFRSFAGGYRAGGSELERTNLSDNKGA